MNGAAPILLRNRTGNENGWAGLRLKGVNCNRDAVGARITWMSGGVKRTRLKTNGGSYLSSHDPREILGLARANKVDWVEIRWPAPSRRVERFVVPVGRYMQVIENEGSPAPSDGL